MKRLILFGALLLTCFPIGALGQTIDSSVFTASINGPLDAPVGRPVLLNAIVSGITTDDETTNILLLPIAVKWCLSLMKKLTKKN